MLGRIGGVITVRRRTLVVAADFVQLYGVASVTAAKWLTSCRFPLPLARVSATGVHDFSMAVELIWDTLRRLPYERAAQALEERATIAVPTVVCGMAEIADLLDVPRVAVRNWYQREALPPPIAFLRPGGQQIQVWSMDQFARHPRFDPARAQRLAERNTIR